MANFCTGLAHRAAWFSLKTATGQYVKPPDLPGHTTVPSMPSPCRVFR